MFKINKKKLTLFALGRQSNMLNINFALPSGSSGRQTAKIITILRFNKKSYIVNRIIGDSLSELTERINGHLEETSCE